MSVISKEELKRLREWIATQEWVDLWWLFLLSDSVMAREIDRAMALRMHELVDQELELRHEQRRARPAAAVDRGLD